MGKKGNKNLESVAWQWTETDDCTINEENIRSSYRLLLPICSNCRKNCSGNPKCLHGLGEAAWSRSCTKAEQKEVLLKIKQGLNAERRLPGELVGLRNLGATCYVNTYLQLWFHNLEFRNAIFALEDHTLIGDNGLPQSICGQLQLMFGLLQNSVSKSVDPTSFINCLGLPTDLQQDAQEFSKLFMCLLETTPGLSQVIQDQFCGKSAYITRCTKCQTVVETASKFYELDVNIQGHKDLKSSIFDYLKEEHLQNDNQYFCDICNSKQDAVRQIVLKELPPCLNIQLLRFVYDRASQQKYKINTNLSFPETLDFSKFVVASEKNNATSNFNLEYNLSAVLLHRGMSASSGHFVAHIYDSAAETWFQFNDEVVAKMKKGKKLDLDGSSSDDNAWNDIKEPPAPKKCKASKGRHSSKDVYMLVYTRKTTTDPVIPTLPVQVSQCVKKENAKFETEIIENFKKAQQEYQEQLKVEAKLQDLVSLLQSRKAASYEWVPTALIKNYLHHGKLSNFQPQSPANFFCTHGNLSLSCLNNLKYVPQDAADVLYADNSEVLRLKSDLCQQCVYNRCMFLQGKRKLTEDGVMVSEALQAFENELVSNSKNTFYIGRASFRKWKFLAMQDLNQKYQPKISLVSEENDNFELETCNKEEFKFNFDLLCSHQNLTIDISTALVVPQLVWDVLSKYFPQSPTFNVEESKQCVLCYNEVKEREKAKQLLKAKANEQKNALYQLYLNKNRPVYPTVSDITFDKKCSSEKYYIVSHAFLNAWKDFVRYPNKYELVDEVENSIFLCCHQKLLYDLPMQLSLSHELNCDEELVNDSEPHCLLLWENEWDYIERNFSVDFIICVQKRVITPCSVVIEKMDEKSVPSALASLPLPQNCGDGPKQSVLIQASLNNSIGPGNKTKKTVDVTISPELCLECIKGLAMEEKKKMQVYNDAEIFILKSTKTVVEMLECVSCETDGVSKTKAQRSSRSRHCARGEKRLSNISSALTLKQLKLKIMTLFSVPPFDQNLWLNGRLLSDDMATIGSLNIIPGCTVTLVEDVPNPDDAPYIYETSKSAEPEVGFIGTSLIGHT